MCGVFQQPARELDQHLKRTVDPRAWESAVKSAYVFVDQRLVGQPPPDISAINAEVLGRAKEQIANQTLELLHYFPCYLFDTTNPSPFSVGSIEFIPGSQLYERIEMTVGKEPSWAAVYRQLASSASGTTSKPPSAGWPADQIWQMSQFPWIAVIPTSTFEPRMAELRATDMARLAIAGVGLNVNPRQSATMSLAYEWHRPRHRITLVQPRGGDIAPGMSRTDPQIHAEEGRVQKYLLEQREFLDWLGQVITEAYVKPEGAGELGEAWLNALHWYYTGCTETSDVRAVICFATTLESLSDGIGADAIIEALETLMRIKRTKTLFNPKQWSLEDAVNHIYRSARSESVHGGRFVLFQEYTGARGIASELCRYALLAFQDDLRQYEVKPNRAQAQAGDRKDVFLRALKAAITTTP